MSYLDSIGMLKDYDEKWVPVTERLPEEDCEVLITADRYSSIVDNWVHDDVIKTRFNKDANKFWIETHFPEHQIKIKAWMLIPKPYKEKKK